MPSDAGKGPELRKGYSHEGYRNGYNNIDWSKKPKKTPRHVIVARLRSEEKLLRMLIAAGGQDTTNVELRIKELKKMLKQ